MTQRSIPVQVSNMSGAVALTTGTLHSCVNKADGTSWCWGHNQHGQLGDGTTVQRLTPVKNVYSQCGNGLCSASPMPG